MINRRDAWKPSDDAYLTQTILSHIRNNSTQLRAFEEASEHLLRTPNACGFRWNSTVRHRYKEAIREAKTKRGNSKRTSNHLSINIADFDVQFESCLDGLLKMERVYIDKENEVKRIQHKLNQTDLNKVNPSEDVLLLIDLMNRARSNGLLNTAQ